MRLDSSTLRRLGQIWPLQLYSRDPPVYHTVCHVVIGEYTYTEYIA